MTKVTTPTCKHTYILMCRCHSKFTFTRPSRGPNDSCSRTKEGNNRWLQTVHEKNYCLATKTRFALRQQCRTSEGGGWRRHRTVVPADRGHGRRLFLVPSEKIARANKKKNGFRRRWQAEKQVTICPDFTCPTQPSAMICRGWHLCDVVVRQQVSASVDACLSLGVVATLQTILSRKVL